MNHFLVYYFYMEMHLYTNSIVGADEVGRGALAGPVVAGAIVLPRTNLFSGEVRNSVASWKMDGIVIRDSKLLSATQRELASDWLIKNALAFGIGVGSVAKINKKGIVAATNSAFRQAIKESTKSIRPFPQKLTIDAFFVPRVPNFSKDKQTPIVHGDRTEIAIAAASIIAKVYRDALMRKLSENSQFEVYVWYKNKGYGTREHQDAIKKFGTTKHHRNLFVQKIIQNSRKKRA
jgi:ribonuclease HII